MKKTLLLLASAAMLLVGCAKEKLGPDAGSGEMVTANFTAQMQGMPQTKSVTDGEGTKANRCVMEIYYKGVLYTRDVQPISSMKATFTPRLVSNRTYDVLFWADRGEGLADKYYKTNAEGLGLQAVEMKDTVYTANDDARDAFYITESVPVGQQVSSETFTLTRPFSQVNIITTDAAVIKNANLYPDGVKMVYKAPTKFNLLTETLSEEKKLTVTGAPYEALDTTSVALTLEMDYLFTSKDKSALDIAFEASKTGESTVTSHSFTNIPVQRNYRTNIKGALLTTTGDWTATIVPGWNQPDEEVKFVEAGSVAAANEAFANGATSVKITSVGEEATLYLPQTTKEVTIDFANPSKVITVQYGPAPTKAAGEKPAVVNIATNNVTKFKVIGISNIVWLASNQAALANALNNAVAGQTVALANDITMSETWTPCELNADFNGNGHTIKGMKNTSCAPDYAGLFYVSYSNIKNVTIQDAEFAYGTETMDARGGVLVGDMRRGSIENCHVVGAEFTGYQKVGGLVGFISANADDHTDISIKNCSVKNATFAACGAHDPNDNDDDYLYQAGGLVGYIALGNRNISISNCSVKNIIYDNSKYKGVYDKLNTNNGYLSHTFVGAIFSQTNNAANTLAFTDNTISGTNTQLNANMYGSAYFGWARNPEYKSNTPVTLGKITIDGEEWTPNYPVQIAETGAKYSTLANALTAATAGQTVQILKAGDYTFPGNTKKAITVEGLDEKDADGNYVVAINLNGVSEYNENLTFKHLTFNFTNSEGSDRGFTHCVNMTYNECAFTGLMWGYDSQVSTFNDCLFHQATKYNVWSYGGNLEFNRCLFQTSTGTIVNVYAIGTDVHEVRFNDCTFESLNDVLDKGAILLKGGNNHGHVIVNKYTLKGKFQNNGDSAKYINSADGLYMFSLRDGDFCDAVYITVNGVTHYPYFTIDADGNYSVKNAMGLKMAIKHWNALKAAGEKSITLADGNYNASDMAIFQNYANKSLLIKAENKKQAVITPTAGSKQLIFVVAGMSKTYAGHITIDGIKFDFSNASNKNIESDVISISDAIGTNLPADEKALYSGTYHYGHDITIQNCEIIGLGIVDKDDEDKINANEHCSVVRTENQNGYNVKVQNCVIDKVGYVLTSKITTLAEVSNCTITDVKCVINNSVSDTDCKVTGNTISNYHTYCIRASYGPLTVSGNLFNCKYSGAATNAGVVVLRGSTGNKATITGNTFTKASGTMNDVYCDTSWEVDNGVVTKTIPAEYGIMDIANWGN